MGFIENSRTRVLDSCNFYDQYFGIQKLYDGTARIYKNTKDGMREHDTNIKFEDLISTLDILGVGTGNLL